MMTMHHMGRTFGSLLLLVLIGCSASLRVDVSVYKGPIVDTPQGRLDKALGLARACRDVAAHLVKQGYAKQHADLLAEIVAYHDERAEFPHSIAAADDAAKLRSDLIGFSDYCQSVAQRIGFEHMTTWGFLSHAGLMSALVDIDENGRIISVLVNSILTEEEWTDKHALLAANLDRALAPLSNELLQRAELTPLNREQLATDAWQAITPLTKDAAKASEDAFHNRINNIMASQAPGTLITAIRNHPWLSSATREYIVSVFEDRYWDNINPVEVQGTGDVNMMLVKDEAGNWHLKKITNDPTKVIEALRVATEGAISAAMAIGGLGVQPVAPGG